MGPVLDAKDPLFRASLPISLEILIVIFSWPRLVLSFYSLLALLFFVNSLQSSILSPSRFDSLSHQTISILTDLMRKNRESFFDRAREKARDKTKTVLTAPKSTKA